MSLYNTQRSSTSPTTIPPGTMDCGINTIHDEIRGCALFAHGSRRSPAREGSLVSIWTSTYVLDWPATRPNISVGKSIRPCSIAEPRVREFVRAVLVVGAKPARDPHGRNKRMKYVFTRSNEEALFDEVADPYTEPRSAASRNVSVIDLPRG